MLEPPKIAYNVEVIHDCIVRDTEIYRKFNSKPKKLALFREKKRLLDKHPEIKKMINADFIASLDSQRGQFVGRVAWLPSELVITDQRIREMCGNLLTYSDQIAEKTGMRFGPCPGYNFLSGCPSFSPKSKETRAKLDSADIFIAMQSKYFFEKAGIPGWHHVLMLKFKKEVEKISGKGAVTAAFGAGPCQLCHPNPCLGKGECRIPEHHLFALESVGVPVGQLCNDIAMLTGNEDWKIRWIKYFGTPKQTPKRWKLTCGMAVKLG